MNIIPNPTLILLQFFPFAITIAALYFIILKPMFEYLESRDSESSGATSEAKDIELAIQAKRQEIDKRIHEAQTEASKKRAEARHECLNHYNDYVSKHRHDADHKIKTTVQEIAKEKAAARQEIHVQAENFANQIASQIIGRNIA